MITASNWYSEDVEFISLSQPIAFRKPHQLLRFNRSGRNWERIREVADIVPQQNWHGVVQKSFDQGMLRNS